jgi:hypothetical protein
LFEEKGRNKETLHRKEAAKEEGILVRSSEEI